METTSASAETIGAEFIEASCTFLKQDFLPKLLHCLEGMSDDQIWWRPNEQSNSVGNLVLHLSRSNRYYLEQVIGGRDIGRNRDGEFAARGGYSKDQLEALWNETRGIAEGVLNGLEPSQMVHTTERTGKLTTYAQILLHVTHHNAAHMGQIVWITKMRRAGALDDIWMKMRSR